MINRQQGSWNILKEEVKQALQLTVWLMLWQLRNIMMQLVVLRSSMWLMIMQRGYQ